MRIELFTGGGLLLARKVLDTDGDKGQATQFAVAIDFEVSRATAAVLILSSEDEYGRVQALNSVDLQLLPGREEGAAIAAEFKDSFQILSPQSGDEISGGSLTLGGQANSQPGRPLTVQLITREGRVLTFGEVYPHFEQDGAWGTFEIKLSYSVKETTWVQIAITESDPQIPRPIHFFGIEVLLIP